MASDTPLAVARVFGPRESPVEIRQWAADSNSEFIRTQYTLSVATPSATGVRLSALDALDDYGWETLSQLADKYSVTLVRADGEPFATIRDRVQRMGLDLQKLQRQSGWTYDEISSFERGGQVPFRKLDALAAKIGLRAQQLGEKGGGEEDRLGARLRTLIDDKTLKVGDEVVSLIAEASRALADFEVLRARYSTVVSSRAQGKIDGLEQFQEIGAAHRGGPLWISGFKCADIFRRQLGVDAREPIKSVSRIIEFDLDALLLQVSAQQSFTGCAIQRGRRRAVLVNTSGSTGGILAIRSAMAHELGHFLMDEEGELNNVRVDQDRTFDNNIAEKDRVESRANAFAAQFLAPQEEVARLYDRFGRNANAVKRIMVHFGVSRSIVRWQLNNNIAGADFSRTKARVYLDEGAWARWNSRENQIAYRMRRFGKQVPQTRLNKLGLLACKLYRANWITKDALESLLGYPHHNVERIVDEILKIGFLNVFYTVKAKR